MDTLPASPKPRLTTFRCTDLSAAAYCILRGVELLRVEKGQPLAVFVFAPNGAGTVQDYYNGAEASCQDYAAALQAAKRALFAGQERGRGDSR